MLAFPAAQETLLISEALLLSQELQFFGSCRYILGNFDPITAR